MEYKNCTTSKNLIEFRQTFPPLIVSSLDSCIVLYDEIRRFTIFVPQKYILVSEVPIWLGVPGTKSPKMVPTKFQMQQSLTHVY